jgi:hypothetical protein
VPRCSEDLSGQQPAFFRALVAAAKPGRAPVVIGGEIRLTMILV